VGPRAGVEAVENRQSLPLPGIEPRFTGRPARILVLAPPDGVNLIYFLLF
jgi:hypothetical protein